MKLIKQNKFKIFDEIWTVKYYDGIDIPEDVTGTAYKYGECESATRTVRINVTDIHGKPSPEEVIRTSLLHELMHAILDSGQYLVASQDEPMVEWLAKCIGSLIKQKII